MKTIYLVYTVVPSNYGSIKCYDKIFETLGAAVAFKEYYGALTGRIYNIEENRFHDGRLDLQYFA